MSEPMLSPTPDLSSVTAKNIAALRQSRKMTQLELGEALSYSDKAVSKWERGESVPDAYVLCALSRIFGVSVDWILTPHEGEPPAPADNVTRRHTVTTLLAFFGVYAAVTAAFVILATLGIYLWQMFVYAVPVSLIVLLVFNTLWGRRGRNFLLVGLLLATLLLSAYIALLPRNLWMLFLLAAPGELIVWLSHFLRRK
ncbi:MAG: helix-turn-helix transcriptional regulator [Clostridia bacterium]|nr:helix-turn-helix transcriptional regulator [Clostridia bacterium]